MNKNIQDERFLVTEEAICQAFYEIAPKKDTGADHSI